MSMRLPAPARREQILDVSVQVFAQRGFHSTSMNDVAEAAGVTKPVLYQHFASKRGLFTEVLNDVGGQLLTSLGTATAEATTGRDRVQAGFAAYFTFVTENEAAFRVLFGAAARNDPEFASIVDGILEDVAEAISLLIEIPGTAEHRRVLAHAVIGIAEATSRDALTADGTSLEPDRLAAWVAELAWFGLRGVRADDAAT